MRIRYVVREGDTVASIAERFGLGVGDLARINRFGRRTDLRPGAEVIVYTDPALLRPSERAAATRENDSAEDMSGTDTAGVIPP
jgi:LysM repeat protein